jgi:hypothetical protein
MTVEMLSQNTVFFLTVMSSVEEPKPEPEPQRAVSFGRSRRRSRNAMQLRNTSYVPIISYGNN